MRRRNAAVKVLQARSGGDLYPVWTATIKRLIHRYLEHRNKRLALRRRSAEDRIAAPYEGRGWCDATERELISDIMNDDGSHW
jgi:hypothetical protein